MHATPFSAAAAMLALAVPSPGKAAEPRSPADPPQASVLPVAFVENRGQWSAPARFVARCGAMTVGLEDAALLLRLDGRGADSELCSSVVRMAFEGATSGGAIAGETPLPGIYNFFLGNDPARWFTRIPGHASVTCRGLYEGIDFRVRGAGSRVEYDLLLAPGAALERFAARCDGARSLRLDPTGALVIETAAGDLRQPPPVAWQDEPDGARRSVECRFRLLGPDRFGFQATGVDARLGLVVDPGLVFSTYVGGAFGERLYAVETDASGATTLGGFTPSWDFQATPGAFDTSFNGGCSGGSCSANGLVVRLAPTGGSLEYATFLSASAVVAGLSIDPSGAATIAGYTSDPAFPTTPGALDTTFAYGYGSDAFVARLSPAGDALVFSTYFGGHDGERATAAVADSSGATTVAGWVFYSGPAAFPTTPGAFDTTPNGSLPDAFVTRVAPNGDALVYSTLLGGSEWEELYTLDVDSTGEAIVAGATRSPDFPTTAGAFDTTVNGACAGGAICITNVFVSRISASGDGLLASTYLGGTAVTTANAVALDPATSVWVGGITNATDFPTTPGAIQTSAGHAFVSEFSPSLDALLASTFVEGTGGALLSDLSSGPPGSGVRVAGVTWSADFPVSEGAFDTTLNPTANPNVGTGFVAWISPAADAVVHATFLGNDWCPVYSGSTINLFIDGPRLAIDPLGVATVAGVTLDAAFPTTPGAHDTTFNDAPTAGFGDFVVSRLDLLPTGATPYGASTPGCAGPLPIGVSAMPRVGAAGFSLTCAAVSPNAVGFLGLSAAALAAPLPFVGVDVWIDPSPGVFYGVVLCSSDALGGSAVPLPIPAIPALAGFQAFAQFLWPDPCGPAGLAASNAIVIQVQP